jgi:hypothetical protein
MLTFLSSLSECLPLDTFPAHLVPQHMRSELNTFWEALPLLSLHCLFFLCVTTYLMLRLALWSFTSFSKVLSSRTHKSPSRHAFHHLFSPVQCLKHYRFNLSLFDRDWDKLHKDVSLTRRTSIPNSFHRTVGIMIPFAILLSDPSQGRFPCSTPHTLLVRSYRL